MGGVFLHLLHIRIIVRRQQLVFRHVGDKESRFQRQQRQVANKLRLIVGHFYTPRRLRIFQEILNASQERQLHRGLLVAAFDQLLGTVHTLFHRLQIRQTKLGIDDVNIAQRINSAFHMSNVRILEAAHHLSHGIHLANMSQKLVAQAFAFRRALDQTGDVHKTHSRRQNALRAVNRRQLRQTSVRHFHNAYIRLNRTERIVCRFGSRLGNSVEKRAFAYVRQPDNADFQIGTHAYIPPYP